MKTRKQLNVYKVTASDEPSCLKLRFLVAAKSCRGATRLVRQSFDAKTPGIPPMQVCTTQVPRTKCLKRKPELICAL